MELIRGLHNLRAQHRGCVLTIGNFDGLHLGHQALLAHTRELARVHGVPAAVLSFEPTPREYFSREARPGRIGTFRGKVLGLKAQGIERLLLQRFGRSFSALEPVVFVEQLLVRRLGVKAIVVGDDFRFGSCRAGDIPLLRQLGAHHGFEVEGLSSVRVQGERCSSTALRAALAQPDLGHAARLLGRPYVLTGRLRRGLQLGRTLDMPTANIHLHRKPALRLGVYAVRARVGALRWNGVASIGVRPTLGLSRCLLETHVFGDPGALYGEVMEVEFVKYLRDELKFESLDELAAQMQRDKAEAIALLDEQPS